MMSTTELRGATSTQLAEPRQWRIDPTRSDLDSGSAKRDSHLGSEGILNAEHPLIRFVSDRANLTGANLQIYGPADRRELGMTKNPLHMLRTPTELSMHARLVPEVVDPPSA